MMNDFGQRILNETNLLVDDKAHYFEKLLDNPSDLVTWNDIERCVNQTELYKFELIDQNSTKIEIPQSGKNWIYDKAVQDKQFIIDSVNQGQGLICLDYGFYSQKTMEFLSVFENLFSVHAAIHVYCGMKDSKSFTIHDDYPCNFIIQAEGETRWKVYKNKISYLHRTGLMNNKLSDKDLEVDIDVVLKPGDALYIPSRQYHCAYPKGKRISLSIPCWQKLPTEPRENAVDRNYYRINNNV
jgi:hypothetical protein|tara:strand:- start:68 stop:790 length:723 start_codon:yes stop_codon:yes gene_type:complete